METLIALDDLAVLGGSKWGVFGGACWWSVACGFQNSRRLEKAKQS